MNGYAYTRVWRIDHKIVVASRVEEAIELYRNYVGRECHYEPYSIEAIGTNDLPHDFDALIKEDEE